MTTKEINYEFKSAYHKIPVSQSFVGKLSQIHMIYITIIFYNIYHKIENLRPHDNVIYEVSRILKAKYKKENYRLIFFMNTCTKLLSKNSCYLFNIKCQTQF
jgi:hypothetical protein